MTHKTLKEAYESIGTMPRIGDIIGDPKNTDYEGFPPLVWVDGWYFDCLNTSTPGSLVYNASVRRWKENWAIFRDGKQIYPKAENLESIKADLAASLSRLAINQAGSCAFTLRDIEKLIDAKIKEAK